MACVRFTPQLQRFLPVPEVNTAASSLRVALDAVFATNPRLRGYVLDDQGHLRANVVVFIDGQRHDERRQLDVPLRPDSQVYVLQALSGG